MDRLNDILASDSLDQALTKVAAVAEEARTKQAMPEWATSIGGHLSGAAGKAKELAQGAWKDPHSRNALIGGAAGMAGGALTSLFDKDRRKSLLGNALTTGLLGAAVGGGGSLAYDHLLRGGRSAAGGSGGGSGAGPRSSANREQRTQAASQAQQGYNDLARLGFDDKAVQGIGSQVRDGALTPEQGREQMQSHRPGLVEQAGGVVPGTVQALRTGDVTGAMAHADIAGLKNVNPFFNSEYFDPTTAGLAIGGNALGRQLQTGGGLRHQLGRLGDRIADSNGPINPIANPLRKMLRGRQDRLVQGELERINAPLIAAGKGPKTLADAFGTHSPAGASLSGEALRLRQTQQARNLRNTRDQTARASQGRLGRLGGGRLPALLTLAPMVGREWFSNDGYRSGARPAMNIAEANKVLAGS